MALRSLSAIAGGIVVLATSTTTLIAVESFVPIQPQTSARGTSSFASAEGQGRRQGGCRGLFAETASYKEANGASQPPNGEEPPSLPSIRLSINEKARTVTSVCTSGTLCTTSSYDGIEGAPFGSYVDYVLDDEGNPVLLMNEMSMHTQNILRNPDLLVTLFTQLGATAATFGIPTIMSAADDDEGGEPRGQDVSRCSLIGRIERIDPATAEDLDQIRMRYSIAHAYADQVMKSPKFAFYRLIPVKVYFVGGFGVLAKWISVEEYRSANPDILAGDASDIVARLNRDHTDDLLLTAQHLLDCKEQVVEKIRVTGVDRLGMDIRVTTTSGGGAAGAARRSNNSKLQTNEFRVGFRIPVISVEDAKSEILKVFQEAWEIGQGDDWGEDDPEQPGGSVPIFKIAEDSLG